MLRRGNSHEPLGSTAEPQADRQPSSARPHRSRVNTIIDLAVSMSFILGLLWLSFFYQLKVNVPPVEASPFDRRSMYFSVVQPEPGVLWAVGSAGRIIRSEDAGKNWKIQATKTNEVLEAIVSWNGNDAVAAGDNGTILRTADGGAHWGKIDVEMRPEAKLILAGVVLPQTGRALLVGEFGTILASDDRGLTWRHTYPQEDVAWHTVSVGPDGRIWVVGEFGRVVVSDDGGNSWTKLTSPAEATLTSIAFTQSGEAVVAGLSGAAFRSADKGMTWQAIHLPGSEHVFALAAVDDAVMAFGGEGGVYRLAPSAGAWTRETVRPAIQGFVVSVIAEKTGLILAGSAVGELDNGTWRAFR